MAGGYDVGVLIDEARSVAKHAHAPYSRFRVGAAVVSADGRIYAGCNVENAAFGSTVCAEVNAITTAVADGVRNLVAIAVTALDGGDTFPCGNCRQVMREFGIEQLIIDAGTGPTHHTLSEVLPHSFGPEDLADD